MSKTVVVIGISGVTCGGKTTLAAELNKILPNSTLMSQDDYFLPVDDERHTWIPELKHINFDIVSSLDMEKMFGDLHKLIQNKDRIQDSQIKVTNGHTFSNHEKVIQGLQEKCRHQLEVIIVEGFCIFNYKPLLSLFNFKYYLTLSRQECSKRRSDRVYEPPNCDGYFDKCAWPEYLTLLKEVQNEISGVTYFDEFTKDAVKEVLEDLSKVLL